MGKAVTSSSGAGIGAFGSLGLSRGTCRAVAKLGYAVPTRIQRQCIPQILEGRDVVAMARTGSGKTAAFLLPMMDLLGTHASVVGIRGLVVSPTRELALQTWNFARSFANFSDLRICSLIGGGSMNKQFDHLAQNPDIIIACPGRLVHHMVEVELRFISMKIVVFDEADRLFELGFSDQIRKILEPMPPTRQCILTSATMPSALVEFSRVGLRDPLFVKLDTEATLSPNLDLSFFYVRDDDKYAALLFILKEIIPIWQTTAVFVATRYHVELIGMLLAKLKIEKSLVYGNMDNFARIQSLERLRKGESKVLVVTDVAARGLDIPQLDNVIHFDFPSPPKLYIHRSGRTARAGRSGYCVSLITFADLPYLFELSLFLGRKIVNGHSVSSPDSLAGQTNGDSSAVPETGLPDVSVQCTDDWGDFMADEAGQGDRDRTMRLSDLPDLSHYAELCLREITEDPEIAQTLKSVRFALKLCNKTKPSASKTSVRRAKEFVADCGGAAYIGGGQIDEHVSRRLSAQPSPIAGTECVDKTSLGATENKKRLMGSLRAFRPSNHRKFRVLSGEASAGMVHKARLIALTQQLVNKPNASRSDESSSDHVPGHSQNIQSTPYTGSTPNNSCEVQLILSEESATPVSKNRLTVAERRRQKRTAAGASCDLTHSSAETAAEGLSLHSYRPKQRDFFLSVGTAGRKVESCFLSDLNSSKMDLLPDDEDQIKSVTYKRKWNAVRRDYMMVPTDKEGKELKRRNEAGQLVTGEVKKKGIYLKWSRQNKRRIQEAGEREDASIAMAREKRVRGALVMEDANVKVDPSDKPAWEDLTSDIDLVKAINKGLPLTHKQKRKKNKLEKLRDGHTECGGQSSRKDDVVRSPAELAKRQQTEFRNRLQKKPKLAREVAMKAKGKHMAKQARAMEEKGARPRSFFVVSRKRGKGNRSSMLAKP